jgi:hypothetical protein
MVKITQTLNNWISITGFILVVNSLIIILFFQLFTLLYGTLNSYVDFYLYLVIPILLITGLIMIPLGMLFRLKRERKLGEEKRNLPVIDLNERSDRIMGIKILVLTILFLAASALGSYKVYEYTSTPEFCGELCHKVMEPEYSSYLNSSHARVACMSCHSGAGADWLVQSRLAIFGMAYSYFSDNFERPIPKISTSMRPSRETCERCHWPQKFYTRKLINHEHYLTDSANSLWNISLLLKVGPKNTAHGLKEGIHWHINPDVKIEYQLDAVDKESIPWVRYTNVKTGVVKTFSNQTMKSHVENGEALRIMDCIDCHNRPSHLFLSAPEYIDRALSSGQLDKGIPYIKKAAMEALSQDFATFPNADEAISRSINQFYNRQHPELFSKVDYRLGKAITIILEEYHKYNFGEMKVNANTYPNHLGHKESAGCYRCHSGNHKTEKGEVISSDCDLCHSIFEQGTNTNLSYTDLNNKLDFVHPVALKPGKDINLCYNCHNTLFN